MFMDNFKILFLGKDIVSQFKTVAAMDFQIPLFLVPSRMT